MCDVDWVQGVRQRGLSGAKGAIWVEAHRWCKEATR